MEIIEYEDKYLEDVRDLLTELEEYIVSIDEDELDHVHPEYHEKMALLDLEEVQKNSGKCYLAIENDNLDEIVIVDCDLKSMKTIKTDINILDFEDEFTSKVDENTFFDLLKLSNRELNNYKNIFRAYKNISSVFEKNRLFSFSGEYCLIPMGY